MLRLLFYDINIQWRGGYWTVYGMLALIYILIIVNLPIDIRDEVSAGVIFMDTSVLGLIFVGALVLFEKQQGVLNSMSVTPLKLDYYLSSKTISLTILSAVISSLVWIIPLWSFKGFELVLPGVVLSSVVFTLFGLGFSAGVGSFNQFLARIFLGSMIFSIPVIPMLIFPGTGWLVILPANAELDLLIHATKGTFSIMQLVDLAILLIWIFIMRIFAQKQFRKHNLFL